ncbi:MAG: FUSC family protein [Asticcacaulis sp.]
MVLQATIALLLSSHYAGGWDVALHRAGIVAAAGAFQAICVLGLDRVIPKSHPKPVLNVPIPATKTALATYGSVAALSVTAASLAAYGLHLDKAYWAPMTALIVLKPKFQLTRQRGLERWPAICWAAARPPLSPSCCRR